MVQEFCAPIGFETYDGERSSRRFLSRTLAGVALLALSAAAGGLIFHRLPIAAPQFEKPRVASLILAPSPKAAADPYGALLFDPAFSSGLAQASLTSGFSDRSILEPFAPPPAATAPPAIAPKAIVATVEETAPPAPAHESVAALDEDAPVPPPRPAEFTFAPKAPTPLPHATQQARRAAPQAAPADNRNFFEKLFGLGQAPKAALGYAPADGGVTNVARTESSGSPLRAAAPSRASIAYASPQTSIFGAVRGDISSFSGRYDRWTAVYDLSAHVVYLPDGTRLEAHSGLGDRLDDPNHVNERNRGATPPHLYALEPREQLFHGVQALRLNPLGGGDIFGRAGLLAHSYMLGPNGDSNGCVSFRDYDAFLRAYQSGQVKKLAVVARLG